MNFDDLIKKAAKDPFVLKQMADDPDKLASDLNLDNEATTRVRLLGDAIEQISLTSGQDLSRIGNTLGRGLGRGQAAWTDHFTDSLTYTNNYTDDSKEKLLEIYGIGPRRSAL